MTWISDDALARLKGMAALDDVSEDDGEESSEDGGRHLTRGTLVGRRFEVVSPLAAGGMGRVYRAHDTLSGGDVALKVVFAVGPDAAQRFAREAGALAEIRHPHVVRYIAHGALSETDVYLAMDLLEGESLASRLVRGPLAIGDVLALGRAMASGVAALHDRGIVHRDVKPSNVLLVGGDPARATIVDLGLVRRDSDRLQLTHVGAFLGTPGYVAPEQVRGDRVDARADVFALGCVLYECLVGEPTFRGSTITDALAQILLEEPEGVGGKRPEVPVALEALVTQMLKKDAAARPADAGAVARALEGIGTATGFASIPPPPSARPYEPRTIVDSPRGRLLRTRVEGAMRTPTSSVPPPDVDPRSTGTPGSLATPLPTASAHPSERPRWTLPPPHTGVGRRAVPIVAAVLTLAAAIALLVRVRSPDSVTTDTAIAAPALEAAPPAAAATTTEAPVATAPPAATAAPTGTAAEAEEEDEEVIDYGELPEPATAATGKAKPGARGRPGPRRRDPAAATAAPRDKGSVPLPKDPG